MIIHRKNTILLILKLSLSLKMSFVLILNDMIIMTIQHYYLLCRLEFLYGAFMKLNMSIVSDDIFKECRTWLFQSSSLNFRHLVS